jgi:hypothetical protein
LRGIKIVVAVLFSTSILCSLIKFSKFSCAESSSEDKWAVLLEMNDFPEGWSDLPVEFTNSQRIQTALASLGWQDNHIYKVNGNLTVPVVQEAVEWLANNTDTDDIALLYISTHGNWMRTVLQWNSWFPDVWKQLNTPERLLLIDACSAGEFLEPIRYDPLPHISLGCCSASEVSWSGLEKEGLPIIGSVWNYYFTDALCNSSADLDKNGLVSIEEAFNFSTPLVQQYMNHTVFAVPEFLESYHKIGIYPENCDAYPHPLMDDDYSDQLVISVVDDGYSSQWVILEYLTFLILSVFIIATLLAVIVYKRKRH